MWSEETSAKFAHWSELPHCLLGMLPHDNQAAAMARHTFVKLREVVGTEKERYMHMLAYRIMHTESPVRFNNMVESLAGTNEMHPDLAVGLIDANMASTCEQPQMKNCMLVSTSSMLLLAELSYRLPRAQGSAEVNPH